MTKTKNSSEIVKSSKPSGGIVLLVLFAGSLFLMVVLSALSLKFLSPKPTVEPKVIQQAAAATMNIAVPIYVDETVNALLPGVISGTLTAGAPTPIPNTPTPTQPTIPCDLAGFVSDETIPSGYQLKPSSSFTKVWIVRNLGTCTWAEDYALAFSYGELMAGKSPLTLGRVLAPGETMEVSINLVAPAAGGVYSSHWMLQNSSGKSFGLAPNDQPLSLLVSVGPHISIPLDFVGQACFASWSSATGEIKCPSDEDLVAGTVNSVASAMVEAGIEFNLPALEVIPNEGSAGNVRGTYNLLQIQANDVFSAIIACSDNQPGCSLVFELLADPGDHQFVTLGHWTEVTDGSFQKVLVDLSPYAGKTLRLILSVSSNNDTSYDNKGLWISPVILRTIK